MHGFEQRKQIVAGLFGLARLFRLVFNVELVDDQAALL
jgi:hypothetical protein